MNTGAKWTDETPKTVPTVEIDWEDTTEIQNWNEDEEDEVDVTQMTVWGKLVEDSEWRLVVAGHYDWTNSKWSSIHAITKVPPTVRILQPAAEERERKNTEVLDHEED